METVVKKIRDFLNIDQIEFSKQLKVTFLIWKDFL